MSRFYEAKPIRSTTEPQPVRSQGTRTTPVSSFWTSFRLHVRHYARSLRLSTELFWSDCRSFLNCCKGELYDQQDRFRFLGRQNFSKSRSVRRPRAPPRKPPVRYSLFDTSREPARDVEKRKSRRQDTFHRLIGNTKHFGLQNRDRNKLAPL